MTLCSRMSVLCASVGTVFIELPARYVMKTFPGASYNSITKLGEFNLKLNAHSPPPTVCLRMCAPVRAHVYSTFADNSLVRARAHNTNVNTLKAGALAARCKCVRTIWAAKTVERRDIPNTSPHAQSPPTPDSARQRARARAIAGHCAVCVGVCVCVLLHVHVHHSATHTRAPVLYKVAKCESAGSSLLWRHVPASRVRAVIPQIGLRAKH